MCLWGVSPIRLIHKPKASTIKNTTLGWYFLIFFWISFHCRHKPRISILVCYPCWYNTPKMHLSIVSNFPHNYLNLSIINNSNDSPILYSLGFCDFRLFNFYNTLFHSLSSYSWYVVEIAISFVALVKSLNRICCDSLSRSFLEPLYKIWLKPSAVKWIYSFNTGECIGLCERKYACASFLLFSYWERLFITNILAHTKPPRRCLGGLKEEYCATLFVPSEAAGTYSEIRDLWLIMLGLRNPTW